MRPLQIDRTRLLLFPVFFVLVGFTVLNLEYLPSLYTLFSLLRYFIFFVAVGLFFLKKTKVGTFEVGLILYFAVILYSSVRNGVPNLKPIFSTAVTMAALVLTTKSNFGRAECVLWAIATVFSVLIVVNFPLSIKYPDGIWFYDIDDVDDCGAYLLGKNHNQTGATLLAGCFFNWLYFARTGRGRVWVYMLVLLSLAQIIMVGSMTSLVMLTVLALFFVLPSERIKKAALLGFVVFYFLFQTFTVFLLTDYSKVEPVRYLVEDVLNKDLTFSTRATIWAMSELAIVKQPVFGYGLQDKEWNRATIAGVGTHNYVLSLLYKGGIVLFSIAIVIIVSSVYRATRHRTGKEIVAIVFLMILFFMQIFEVYSTVLMLLVYFYLFYLDIFLKTTRSSSKNGKINKK